MRFDCADLPGCYVEYSDAWSVADVNAYYRLHGAEYVALVAHKTIGIYLPLANGGAIDDPAQLTHESLQECDIRAFSWWRGTSEACVEALSRLGEQMRRSLSSKPEATNEDGGERRNP